MNGIYLGSDGHIELERTSNNLPIYSLLDPEDVNVLRSRFSLDYDTEALITGDRIQISTVDKSNLELVAGHNHPDGTWYCHVDPVGGIYLFEEYNQAINNDTQQAIPLVSPSAAQEIVVELARERFRCVANCRSWSMTTSRNQIDITSLGEEYRRQYTNGLISGQGTLSCFWDYEQACGDNQGVGVTFPHYLSQLVLRTKLGGAFKGRFYLKADPKESIWYEALCIVSNVAMQFEPTQPVVSTIDFVTSGPIALRMGMPPGYLLQEDSAFILQEEEDARIMLDA